MTMGTDGKEQRQKRSLLAVIWESMAKTGGCCGSGGNCCGPADPDSGDEKVEEKKVDRNAEKGDES